MMRRRCAVSPLDSPVCTAGLCLQSCTIPLSLSLSPLSLSLERYIGTIPRCVREYCMYCTYTYCTIILIHMYCYIRWACVWVFAASTYFFFKSLLCSELSYLSGPRIWDRCVTVSKAGYVRTRSIVRTMMNLERHWDSSGVASCILGKYEHVTRGNTYNLACYFDMSL